MNILESEIRPRVLTIGGSDPTGAAGIQADLKTLASLGVYSTSVISAVTVQDHRRVSEVIQLPASVLRAQIEAALGSVGADVVKTGLLGSLDAVAAVAETLAHSSSQARLVIDPVIASTTGRQLLPEDARAEMVKSLFPQASLLTPNLPEVEIFTGQKVRSLREMSRAADIFLTFGVGAVLIKGGHLGFTDPDTPVMDLLRTADGEEFIFERDRLQPGVNFRGTGCTLASAIAGYLAEGLTLKAAVDCAGDYLSQAMRASFASVPGQALPPGASPLPRILGHGLRLEEEEG
ncbi:MAG: bifunctional hydroxymethylpyrimidine kinase/phosphomethylpyrimidine kinase [Polyangiaceae bacterium]|nr:bifunctional hydroxymethylpyrimidine kinase/phosphomethylpyrimidine kinase [Polyangiaceae bacterium]